MAVPLTSTLSRYYNSKSLPQGGLTGTISGVVKEAMKDRAGKPEFKPVLYLAEVPRGLVLNKTNQRALTGLFGEILVDETTGAVTDASAWVGKKIHIYVVPSTGGQYESTVAIRKV